VEFLSVSCFFLTARQIVAQSLVQKLLPHFFIRRDKRLLDGQLPKKIDQVAFCPLTEKQKVVYRNFLNAPEVDDMLRKDEECECGSQER
jgi:SNF2 family DNA or RNA helicase